LLIIIIEYERYLDHAGAGSAFDVIIPYRYGSQLWGRIANLHITTFLRVPIYSLYAKAFGVNLNEMALPLDAYESLGDFFARPLKPGTNFSHY
jgi:phosphatidylserine decarboxylase